MSDKKLLQRLQEDEAQMRAAFNKIISVIGSVHTDGIDKGEALMQIDSIAESALMYWESYPGKEQAK